MDLNNKQIITDYKCLVRSDYLQEMNDKILNRRFPDTELHLSSLTTKDQEDLDFITTHANQVDIIGYSYVQTPADIQLLQQELATRLQENSPHTCHSCENRNSFSSE